MGGRPAYDALVVGGGLAGLAAGAVLARRGLSVAVVEQSGAAGGYAHAFKRGPYVIDPALHTIQEARDGQVQEVILSQLAVRDRVKFLEVDPLFDVKFPGFSLQAPAGGARFAQAYADAFPADGRKVAEFWDLCGRVHNEAHDLPPQIGLRVLDSFAERFPTLFQYQKKTTAEVLDSWFEDDRLKAAVSGSWPMMGLPPSKLDFVSFAQILTVSVHGTFFIEGGFQVLVDALVSAFERDGGDLLLESRVDRIEIEDRAVKGVRISDGRELRASAVISGGDASATLEGLVGPERLPERYIGRLRKMEPSVSAFVLFTSSKLDLASAGMAHDVYAYQHWDHDRTWADMEAGRPGVMWLNTATLVDPTLAPDGEHLVVVMTETPYDIGRPWAEVEEEYAEQMLARLDAVMPRLRESLTVIDTATPETFKSYTSNTHGAMLGWAQTPRQSGSRRLSNRTPVEGLYLAGHWAQPGAGSIRALASGVMCARMVLDRVGAEDFEIPLSLEASWHEVRPT